MQKIERLNDMLKKNCIELIKEYIKKYILSQI